MLAAALACSPDQSARNLEQSAELTATASANLPLGLVCGLSYTTSTALAYINGVAQTFNNDNLGQGFPYSNLGAQHQSVLGDTNHAYFIGSCNGTPTVSNCAPHALQNGFYGESAWWCQAQATPQPGYALHVANDAGDAYSPWSGGQTAPGPWGFVYQAYQGVSGLPAASGATGSDQFALPKGTACGLAHSSESVVQTGGPSNADPTCMGYSPLSTDPALRCPPGWASKYAFDQSSGNGSQDCQSLNTQSGCAFWGWCEYQDPHNLCDGACLQNAVQTGVAVNLRSDTEPNGYAWCTDPANAGSSSCTCYGGAQTPYFDRGRGAGQGLSWCGNYVAQANSSTTDAENFCPQVNPTCNSWSNVPNGSGICESPCLGYVGCFTDTPSRVLPVPISTSVFNIGACVSAAWAQGYKYAGLENGRECYGGNSVDGLQQINQTRCSTPCADTANQFCGGTWALSIYETKGLPLTPTNVVATGSASLKIPSEISLSWTTGPVDLPSNGYAASGYRIFRDSPSSLLTTVTNKSYIDTNVADGPHTYWVQGFNQTGQTPEVAASANAEHCDPNTCTGCCSGNTCLGGNQLSTGCVAGGNVCGGACPAGNVCSNGACACSPLTQAQACGGTCGTASNGCGGTYNCGSCAPPPPPCKNCVLQ